MSPFTSPSWNSTPTALSVKRHLSLNERNSSTPNSFEGLVFKKGLSGKKSDKVRSGQGVLQKRRTFSGSGRAVALKNGPVEL